MPIYSWVDPQLNIFVRAEIGNGHSGGISARLGVQPVGEGNDEMSIDLGAGGACVRKTLIVTAEIHRGVADPPPPPLLTIWVHQGASAAAPPKNPRTYTSLDPAPFNDDGFTVVPYAVTFI
jgi:hypothetical protein